MHQMRIFNHLFTYNVYVYRIYLVWKEKEGRKKICVSRKIYSNIIIQIFHSDLKSISGKRKDRRYQLFHVLQASKNTASKIKPVILALFLHFKNTKFIKNMFEKF